MRLASARWRRHAAALALFGALTVLHTWPLATGPATLSRNDNSDTVLNEWILAWVAHQLPRAPLQLFHANIFYPDPNTLAYSEHMVVQSVMGMPLFLVGASPVLVYNVLLMAGFALTAWMMYLVIDAWTGDAIAAVAAGSLAAFNAHVFTRLPHVQALHVEFLPLAVAALHGLLADPGPRVALRLGLLFALQSLTSTYWLAFISLSFVAAGLVRPRDWTGARLRAAAPMIVLAAGVALAMVVPFLLPYYSVMRRQGMLRPLDEIASLSATWRDYMCTTGRLHWAWWSSALWDSARTPLFPGVIGAGLALVAVVSGVAWRDLRARLWLAITVAAIVFSFGAAVPGYAMLWEIFPVLKGVRAPVRMGHLALIGIAALAGFGLAYLRRRGAGRRWVAAASIAAVAAIHAEALRAPMGYMAASLPGAEYDALARDQRAIVAEFPFYAPRQFFGSAQYMLNSTRHWRPIVNGYSGFLPRSYVEHYESLQSFPDARALQALADIGVTHVVVHHQPPSPVSLGFGPMPEVDALEPVTRSPALTIYRLRWERVPGRR